MAGDGELPPGRACGPRALADAGTTEEPPSRHVCPVRQPRDGADTSRIQELLCHVAPIRAHRAACHAVRDVASRCAGRDEPRRLLAADEPAGTAAQDASGNANTGAISGGVSHVPGRFDRALSFDGFASQVLIARSASLEPASITVETWVRASTTPGAFRYVIANGANRCLVPSYGLYTGASGGLAFVVSAGEESNFTASPNAGPGVWDGAWHHIAGTFDGATARLYVDGIQIGAGTATALPIAYGRPTSTDGVLGAFGGGPCAPGDGQLNYVGDLDEPRIWRRALSATEIQASAAMGGAHTTDLGKTVTSSQAIVYTSAFSNGHNIAVSIESATGTERIDEIRIHQVLPIGTGLGCGGGLLFSPCDIALSNGARTATLSVTRHSYDGEITLKVRLESGRTLYVDVAG